MKAALSLDLFVLTFNCGKNIIDVDVFARHLCGALLQHGQGRGNKFAGEVMEDDEGLDDDVELPDLVVFSLQEISPLANGYLGGQLLNPYLTPFKEALNLAASQVTQQRPPSSATGGSSPRPTPTLQRSTSAIPAVWRRKQQDNYPYKLVEARNVGMTAIMLFARKPDAIHHIRYAECAFGIANMGNKGAVALRVTYADAGTTAEDERGEGSSATMAEGRTTELTFVATHLAAMEYNLRRRNANWASIASSCLFEDPKKILPPEYHMTEPGAKNIIEASTKSLSSSSTPRGKQTDGGEDIPPETEEELQALLERQENATSIPRDIAKQLHDASVFKGHLFLGGDLNYRISTKTPPSSARFPTLEDYLDYFERDQLTKERTEGRTLHGLSEAPVRFPPTYKIKHLSRDKVADAANAEDYRQAPEGDVVPWKWASHRWPGWCDRILYLEIPSWVKRRHVDSSDTPGAAPPPEIKIHAYNSMPTMLSSDHQPVFLRASVPLLTPDELSPPVDDTEFNDEDAKDPRVTLPIPIDTGAWERRAVARRREVITGIMTLFVSTKEGALVIATVAVVGLWSYWLLRGLF